MDAFERRDQETLQAIQQLEVMSLRYVGSLAGVFIATGATVASHIWSQSQEFNSMIMNGLGMTALYALHRYNRSLQAFKTILSIRNEHRSSLERVLQQHSESINPATVKMLRNVLAIPVQQNQKE